jgi:hypothetical protein
MPWTLLASDVVVGKPINGRDVPNNLLVQVSENPQGKVSLRICKAWTPEGTDDLKPTKQGFNIHLDDVMTLKKAITNVVAKAK